MKKVYYLSSCTTCKRIMAELDLTDFGLIQDIKKDPLAENQLAEMVSRSGTFEPLFNKRAIKFRSIKLNKKKLTEADYKKMLLQEYTFLKRPVFLIENDIFIGNSTKTIDSLKKRFIK